MIEGRLAPTHRVVFHTLAGARPLQTKLFHTTVFPQRMLLALLLGRAAGSGVEINSVGRPIGVEQASWFPSINTTQCAINVRLGFRATQNGHKFSLDSSM